MTAPEYGWLLGLPLTKAWMEERKKRVETYLRETWPRDRASADPATQAFGDWFYGCDVPEEPGEEPDPQTCSCAASAPGRGGSIDVAKCDWVRYHEHHATKQDARRTHVRAAMNWQTSGYKGAQHWRSVERARTERDKRSGRE